MATAGPSRGKPAMTAPGSQGSKASDNIHGHFRGWRQRHNYKISKQKALKRSTNFKTFVDRYRAHCIEIMKRHGEENPKVYIEFVELNEYIEKILKFEINFQMMLPKDQDGLPFKEFRNFYTKCQLHPSLKEMQDAARLFHQDPETFNEHLFTKKEIVDISLHIYVPRGTHMVVRKSTWLNPIIDGKEALAMPAPKRLAKDTSVKKAMKVVVKAKKERDEDDAKLLEKLGSPNYGLSTLLDVQQTSTKKSKSSTKLGRKK
eukprot:gene708-10419_t